MAFWFSRSRLTNHLIRKMGSSQILKRSSWISSSLLLDLRNPSLIHGVGRNPPAVLENLKTHSADCRFASTKAGEERDTRFDNYENQGESHSEGEFLRSNSQFPVRICGDDDGDDKSLNLYQFHTCPQKVLDFPGGRVMFTYQLKFISESPEKRADCFRVLDDNGQAIAGNYIEQVNEEVAVKMYGNMVTLQIMDNIFYEAQRQGRISFYLTSIGEEAINIASAAALTIDDLIFPQYREPGVLLWRGFSLQEFANQCFSNKADYGKGRQMPIHYGSNKLNYFTISSPIATQIPQAVGAAYSLKMDQKNACAVTYFGDGGTSEGDFHAALNFAAVMEAPVIFFCRNNGWAISTPTSEQFRSDGLVVRGPAYGIRSIRVDGNDALAVYSAVRAAREMAINEHRPILIEALTYRAGHHSTSDDSTKYRPVDEIEHWKTMRDPVSRFRKWVEGNGWWSEVDESELRSDVRKKILDAIQAAEKAEKPPLADLFTDVYSDIPSNLREQERSLRETVQKHPQDYPPDVPV